MRLENGILKLLKEKPLLISELGETPEVHSILAFLQRYELVEITTTTEAETLVKITPRGLQLLNLPNLPEEESSSNQLEIDEREHGHGTYLFSKTKAERRAEKDKTIHFCSPDQLFSPHETLNTKTSVLYTTNQDSETIDWVVEMAVRYNVRPEDIIHALWAIAKDSVGAKLEQDVKANHSFFAVTPPLVSAKTEGKR